MESNRESEIDFGWDNDMLLNQTGLAWLKNASSPTEDDKHSFTEKVNEQCKQEIESIHNSDAMNNPSHFTSADVNFSEMSGNHLNEGFGQNLTLYNEGFSLIGLNQNNYWDQHQSLNKTQANSSEPNTSNSS